MIKQLIQFSSALSFIILIMACKKQIVISSGENLEDWTSATHSSSGNPNYDTVFNNNKVNRIDIVIKEDDWSDMQKDLEDVLSSSTGGGDFSEQTPEYIRCDLFFNGRQWYNVGVRYKGNSSLQSTYQQGLGKLPLRLKMDEFEEDYPEITDQRFFGFAELALGNNFDDLSLMREKTACDLFRNFGVPAVHTSFYEVYIDHGNGPQYFGVYTMTEIVFDTFLKDYFGSNTGNCYKPDGDGAQFYENIFDLDNFEQKTSGTSKNKSDIKEMCTVLNADTRTSNPTKWRGDLEAVFDVDGFLKYLAVNNTIQNWDTYGNMSHNYYLYHDPKDDLLKWIVWDNNEAFQEGKREGALSFGMNEVGTDWPLINYIVADDTYLNTYKSYLKSFISTSFEYNRMNTIYTEQSNLLNTSAANEITGYSFLSGLPSLTSAVAALKSHCATRVAAAAAYAQ